MKNIQQTSNDNPQKIPNVPNERPQKSLKARYTVITNPEVFATKPQTFEEASSSIKPESSQSFREVGLLRPPETTIIHTEERQLKSLQELDDRRAQKELKKIDRKGQAPSPVSEQGGETLQRLQTYQDFDNPLNIREIHPDHLVNGSPISSFSGSNQYDHETKKSSNLSISGSSSDSRNVSRKSDSSPGQASPNLAFTSETPATVNPGNEQLFPNLEFPRELLSPLVEEPFVGLKNNTGSEIEERESPREKKSLKAPTQQFMNRVIETLDTTGSYLFHNPSNDESSINRNNQNDSSQSTDYPRSGGGGSGEGGSGGGGSNLGDGDSNQPPNKNNTCLDCFNTPCLGQSVSWTWTACSTVGGILVTACISDTCNKGTSKPTNEMGTAIQHAGESLYHKTNLTLADTRINLVNNINTVAVLQGHEPIVSDEIRFDLVREQFLAEAEANDTKTKHSNYEKQKQQERIKMVKAFETKGNKKQLSPQSQARFDQLKIEQNLLEESIKKTNTQYKGQFLGESYRLSDLHYENLDECGEEEEIF